MRDDQLILHDGTNFVATITPVTVVRAADGSAVLDIGKTGEKGISVQLCSIDAITLAAGVPTIDAKLQASDSATFASGVEDLASWPQLDKDTPAGYRRTLTVHTKRRYLRCLLTVGGVLTTEHIEVHVVSGPDRDDDA